MNYFPSILVPVLKLCIGASYGATERENYILCNQPLLDSLYIRQAIHITQLRRRFYSLTVKRDNLWVNFFPLATFFGGWFKRLSPSQASKNNIL